MEPASLATQFSNQTWRRYRHLDFLSARISQAAYRPLRLLVPIPPRHGKSVLCSQYTPVWFLANWPCKRVILASYEADFAASWGRKARDTIVGNPGLGIAVKEDVAGASIWETTDGGGMVTAGVGGPITGRGGDLIVVDDPIKNFQEANSIVFRDMLRDWWDTTLWTRREPGASAIVAMARWHRDDLIGWLRRKGGEPWEYIEMPAIAGPNDALGRVEGEPLWPQRYPLEALEATRIESGETAWMSLYQQHPEEVAGDCYFDVRVLTELLKTAKQGEIYKPYVVGRRYAAGIDPSGQGKDRHSLSILDCQTGEFVVDYTSSESVGEHALKAVDLLGKYHQPLVVVEATGVGLAYLEALRHLGYPVSKIYQRPSPGGNLTRLTLQERLLGTTPGPSLRDRILVDLAEGIRQGALILYSAAAIDECLSFLRSEKGHPEAAEGAHDDRVMSMAWAVFASKQMPSIQATQSPMRVARFTYA